MTTEFNADYLITASMRHIVLHPKKPWSKETTLRLIAQDLNEAVDQLAAIAEQDANSITVESVQVVPAMTEQARTDLCRMGWVLIDDWASGQRPSAAKRKVVVDADYAEWIGPPPIMDEDFTHMIWCLPHPESDNPNALAVNLLTGFVYARRVDKNKLIKIRGATDEELEIAQHAYTSLTGKPFYAEDDEE